LPEDKHDKWAEAINEIKALGNAESQKLKKVNRENLKTKRMLKAKNK